MSAQWPTQVTQLCQEFSVGMGRAREAVQATQWHLQRAAEVPRPTPGPDADRLEQDLVDMAMQMGLALTAQQVEAGHPNDHFVSIAQ